MRKGWTYHNWVNPLNNKNCKPRNYMNFLRTTSHNKGTTQHYCTQCDSETEHLVLDASKDAIQESALKGRLLNGVMIDCKVCIQCDGGTLPC